MDKVHQGGHLTGHDQGEFYGDGLLGSPVGGKKSFPNEKIVGERMRRLSCACLGSLQGSVTVIPSWVKSSGKYW